MVVTLFQMNPITFFFARKDIIRSRKDIIQSRKDIIQSRKDIIQSRKDIIQSRKDIIQSRKDITVSGEQDAHLVSNSSLPIFKARRAGGRSSHQGIQGFMHVAAGDAGIHHEVEDFPYGARVHTAAGKEGIDVCCILSQEVQHMRMVQIH